jgi:hypothetical protein
MIVNSLKDGWEIIFQRSHALLAAELAAQWDSAHRPERWIETLVAISQHDDQENFWQGNHLSEIGAPLNFDQVPLDTRKLLAQQVIENAQRQSLWIALLISRHNSFLYEPMRGQDAALDQFLDQQVEQQQAWRKALKVSAKALEKAYALVGWADRLSLILCQRQIPERQRTLEICQGPDGESHQLLERDDGTLQVIPWPFAISEFTVSIETRRAQQLRYNSVDELRRTVENAPITRRDWTFVK